MRVSEIKSLVREWFATLSIEEIIQNKELVTIFEHIESILLTLEPSV